MDEATCTELILYEGIEKVKQFMGHFVKVETIVHSRHKKEPFTSPIWADEASSQHTHPNPNEL